MGSGPGSIEVLEHRGWELVRLTGSSVQVDIVPQKGADIAAVRWQPLDLNVLWTTPWGLRARGSATTAAGSATNFLENYPGGWQTIFPNGGPAVTSAGAELPFHGEATLSPWSWQRVDNAGAAVIELDTRLVRSPFRLRRLVSVDADSVEVVETATNEGTAEQQVMWSHHPALGAPFLSGACRIEVAAKTFIADDERDTPAGDLAPGARSAWPMAVGRAGAQIDISRVPADDQRCDRFGYLTDFDRGWAAVTNDELRLRVELDWDLDPMPHAWLWLEDHATDDFPWFGAVYVLALEPASSHPGQGLDKVREKTGTQLTFAPGQSRTARVRMSISPTKPRA